MTTTADDLLARLEAATHWQDETQTQQVRDVAQRAIEAIEDSDE